MNSEIDDEIGEVIREAVREQERRAAPAERVRAALPSRAASYARRRRTARGLTAVTAVTAAVAVAVAVPAVLREPDRGGGVADPSTATSTTRPDSAAPDLGSVALRFAPAWLPEGMVERTRVGPLSDALAAKSGVTRIWSRAPLDPGTGFLAGDGNIGLYATAARPDEGAAHLPPVTLGEDGRPARTGSGPEEVDINGRPGREYGGNMLVWQPDERTTLALVAPGVGLSDEDLLRIARSVRPDPAVLRAPLRLNWLPEGMVAQDLTVAGNSATEWEAGVMAEQKTDPGAGAQRFVAAHVGTQTRSGVPRDGERLEIAGRPAYLSRTEGGLEARPGNRTEWVLVVDLGQGRRLTVQGGTGQQAGRTPPPTREDMIRVAENIEVAEPDLTWFGR
ncbi:hypothetical protein [Actinophytocola xanthii]|uniref:Uncharacterized protein n=1 Tax=Actinophytocola xanthii TaxID=1912961 RepID=A0A1Q8CJT0_9PSEU|nr:hypothetical protein [Actinophytocola xanthii]OLF14599.1 hypothetical protein BU204_25960 [Actinophytocola xanthii]